VFRRRRRVVEEQAAPAGPRRRPLIWPWLLLLLVLVAGGLAAAYFLTRDDDDDDAPSAVPSVVGLTERAAVERLDREGYTAEVRRQRNANRPPGTVFDQEPDAGAELERGEDVVVSVARAPQTVSVPRVVGLPVAEAFERLQGVGLRGRSIEVASPRGAGTVISQQPGAGRRTQRGAVVVLTVSRGRQTVTVPSLVGLSEAQAGATLQRLGLRVNVVRVPSRDAAGTVIAQVPAAGVRRPRGSIVRINVSRGSPAATQVTVPDVVQQDEVAARETLSASGFTVRAVDRTTSDPAQDGVVLEQRPRGGQRARRGSQVLIFIGRLA
jgi:beta-lactam-binding protein with PASTA domain